MAWDIVLYIILMGSYLASLIVFILKRPDRRLSSKWQKTVMQISYPLAGLILIWFTINLFVKLVGS